ncbi:MAG: hypothetical protein IJU40_03890 [Desulfovibrionaceae bacterium]|nr:hypothetical protein [Desulfovibrionaceae bacterium]
METFKIQILGKLKYVSSTKENPSEEGLEILSAHFGAHYKHQTNCDDCCNCGDHWSWHHSTSKVNNTVPREKLPQEDVSPIVPQAAIATPWQIMRQY